MMLYLYTSIQSVEIERPFKSQWVWENKDDGGLYSLHGTTHENNAEL